MGVGSHSDTHVIVVWYLHVEKNSIKSEQKFSIPNSL